ncbi:MAG: hypothetical protein HYW34_01840 [Candidatus Brennerbacteria bacterium]|nr:hypothetical protein [Candidatus Brennerbacteria bacterium]
MSQNYFQLYVKFLNSFINIKKPLKVVFDCSNGTTGLVLNKLKVKSLKLNVVLINSRPDGNFSAHGPNPTAAGALKQLQKAVIQNKADLGAIFDADGDRAFFIDNKGRVVDSDVVAYLLIWYFKINNLKRELKVIADVRTGWLVKKNAVTNLDFQLVESKVGHFFIKKLMKQKKIPLGCEQSGHYYFFATAKAGQATAKAGQIDGLSRSGDGPNGFYFDSGITAALQIISAVSRLPYYLSDFIDLLPVYHHSGEMNFKIQNKELILKAIEKKYRKSAARISRLDGLTMEFKNGIAGGSFDKSWWFNLRLSNTEPLLRLNVEAVYKDIFKNKLHELKKVIDSIS